KEPLIIYTVYDKNSISEKEKEAGVSDYCEKPLFISELRKVLLEIDEEENMFERKEEKELNFAGKKILLVEDNELNQEIAFAILTEAGFVVDVVADGTEAVAKMQEASVSDYDLILMDVQMPKMDGYKATRLIRALPNKAVSCIPIIAMTANAFEEDKQHAFASGMNAHISKPIDVQNLIETLRDIIK
ncbi:MAG: response regulator, partial [Treponema sp.]|nr:response regulator [Treponema sp.]